MTKLGQHFLKSKKIIDKIIETADLTKSDVVLEVGPGKGILTKSLLENAGLVIGVEKDKELVRFLEEKLKDYKNLNLIHADILKFDILDLIRNLKLEIRNFKIIANLPYYITSRFLRNFLQTQKQPSLMVLMVQKEVAQRIVATPPNMSILSVSVQAYGQPKIISNVPKGHFSPPPKVDSAILKIENISKNFFGRSVSDIDQTEKKFFELVNKGFSHKRKMLKNNLGISSDVLIKSGLSEKVRAQELSLKDWERLYQNGENLIQ